MSVIKANSRLEKRKLKYCDAARNWSRENIAWLAGLIEGEGCFSFVNNAPYITVGMTDKDVILKAHAVSGIGTVSGPYLHRNKKYKPSWRWKVSGGRYVYALCVAVYPFMGARRSEKIRSVIDKWVAMSRSLPLHGSTAKYKQGCRCIACVEAMRSKRRAV